MKTRALVGIILVLSLVGAVFGAVPGLAQGCPDCDQSRVSSPLSPSAPLQGGTYFTNADNEDNARTGSPDGDMGGQNAPCVFNYDAIAPIEFNINVTGALPASNAALTLYAFDVDEEGAEGFDPEVDNVYFNGKLVGTMTGVDQAWSTSVFPLNISDVQAGNNLVEIDIDTLDQDWCVAVDWGQLLIDGGTEDAAISSMATDACYEVGAVVPVDVMFGLAATQAGNYRLETNLLDPSNVTVGSDVHPFAATAGAAVNYTAKFALTNASPVGAYTVNASLFNDTTQLLQDVEITTFQYAASCAGPAPEYPEDVVIDLIEEAGLNRTHKYVGVINTGETVEHTFYKKFASEVLIVVAWGGSTVEACLDGDCKTSSESPIEVHTPKAGQGEHKVEVTCTADCVDEPYVVGVGEGEEEENGKPGPPPVPEASTLVLMGSGLAGIASYIGLRRRASKK